VRLKIWGLKFRVWIRRSTVQGKGWTVLVSGFRVSGQMLGICDLW
jgi:hypothetical protein